MLRRVNRPGPKCKSRLRFGPDGSPRRAPRQTKSISAFVLRGQTPKVVLRRKQKRHGGGGMPKNADHMITRRSNSKESVVERVSEALEWPIKIRRRGIDKEKMIKPPGHDRQLRIKGSRKISAVSSQTNPSRIAGA